MEMESNSEITPPQEIFPTSPVQTELSKKSGYKLVILLIIILALFVGGGTYYLNTQGNKNGQSNSQVNPKTSPVSSLKSFTDSKYPFLLNHPADWSFTENQSSDEFGKLNVLQFTPSDKSYIFYVTVLDNTNAARFQGNTSTQKQYNDWLALAVKNNQSSPSASQKLGNIKIDSINAVQFLSQTHPEGKQANYGMLTWVRNNNINYYIGVRSDSSQTVQSTSKIYSQVLTSFKFTK